MFWIHITMQQFRATLYFSKIVMSNLPIPE